MLYFHARKCQNGCDIYAIRDIHTNCDRASFAARTRIIYVSDHLYRAFPWGETAINKSVSRLKIIQNNEMRRDICSQLINDDMHNA